MVRYREDAGRRLLPHVVDELARDEPDHILYEFPANDDITLPFAKITTRDFANAVNRAAWWLEENLGKGVNFPTIGYTGPQDLRYFIFVIAAVKVGYQMLYTSLRNSVEGDIAVVDASQCQIWLVPGKGSNVQRLLDRAVQLNTVPTPDLAYFIDTEPVPHYEYNKTWEMGKRDPCWVLHTSGSTGNPKPVFRFLDSAASIGANSLLPKVNGRPLLLHDYYDSRVYLTFPFFHAAGLANGLLWALFNGTTVVIGPDRQVTLDLMKSVIRHAKPSAVFTAPSLVEDISKDSEFLSLLETVQAIGYGGGPVSREAGDRVWKHTKLRLSIGTTETGWLPCVETDPDDWSYIHLHPNTGIELQDRGGGLYELVALRNPELGPWQPIFSTFPDLQEYSFKDLFSRHPTKPELYTYEGRADNVIVLSNGEKVQPHNMELIIGAHRLVKSVVVAGQGRFQTSAVVELQDGVSYPRSAEEHDELLRLIWPAFEEANKAAHAHAKLHRDFVVFASPDKPFAKTSKGTLRRGPIVQLYAEELGRVYQQAEDGTANGTHYPQLDLSTPESLNSSVREAVEEVIEKSVGSTDDFFVVAGADSLQVMALRRRLARALSQNKTAAKGITTSLIYRNPTVDLLSRALWELATQHHANGNGVISEARTQTTGASIAEALLEKYSSTLPLATNGTGPNGAVVLLTGSTGSLGSYVLDELMRNSAVSGIWCLNRSADAEFRQKQLHTTRGLGVDFEARNVRFLHANLAADSLGLDAPTYEYLSSVLTHIIHTQWQVDFNLAVSSFEPHIRGVRNLISLALQATDRGRHPNIFFTSSVGVANNAISGTSSIPEAPISDFSSAGSGYGESKLVAERLLEVASRTSGLHVTVCRVGQITGPVKPEHRKGGAWNRKEWLPSIVDASAHLSLIPQALGKNELVDWIPVDLLSSVIIELADIESRAAKHHGAFEIFHAVNPVKVRWEEALLPIVQSRLSNKRANAGTAVMKIVSLQDWVAALEDAAAKADDGEGEAQLSALKLVPFFRALAQGEQRPAFETAKSEERSESLQKLQPVSAEWTDTWLTQWGY